MKADEERAQVTMRRDRRFLPRCGGCGNTQRINRVPVTQSTAYRYDGY